ncbi:MAG TPA: STAS/SEC14 domain-containing protein [Gemmatimonadaceae bacterium]|nr:STAS/SEC14 domain-containing protein [Gemmatimonadaceae bacterium]
MPVIYEFHGSIVAIRLTGSYETADVRAALHRALDDPRCPRAAGLLLDIRGSQSISRRTANEVRAMAQFIASHADRFGRRLALLADTDAAFGLMRLGAVIIEQQGVETSVFRHPADAEEWLGSAPTS